MLRLTQVGFAQLEGFLRFDILLIHRLDRSRRE